MKLKPLKWKEEAKPKGKKGFVAEFGFVLTILFAIAITIILNKIIFTNFSEKLVVNSIYNSSNVTQAIVLETTTSLYQAMDNMFLGIFMTGFIFLAVISFAEPIRTSRAFFPISIFIIIPIMILLSTILSNTYQQFGENSEWAAGEVGSTLLVQIMDNFPFYVFGMSILLLLVIFGINKSEGG